ncbi:MAG: Ig-like domain-containing protein, partial [Lachnospiraceae bacterium]|nr:Ig-like domain-containing protein [Lachnospiraceae bacterium]
MNGEENLTGKTLNLDPGTEEKRSVELTAVSEGRTGDGWSAEGIAQEVVWESSNTDVATVTDGTVTAVANGQAIITATATDELNKSSRQVMINSSTLMRNLTITGSDEVKKGESIVLQAVPEPETTSEKSVIWESDAPQLAKVDSEGRVTGLFAGEATITATAIDGSGVSASKDITVTAKAEKINIKSQSDAQTILNDTTISLNANRETNKSVSLIADMLALDVSGEYSKTGVSQLVAWSSDNPDVASVDAAGVVTAIGNGTATITASAIDGSDFSASVDIKVTTLMKSMEITGPDVVYRSRSITLMAEPLPAETSNREVIWKSDKPAIARVDASGHVTGVSVGKTTITAIAKDGSEVTVTKDIVVIAGAETGIITRNGAPDTKLNDTTIAMDPALPEKSTVELNVRFLVKDTLGQYTDEWVDQQALWKSANTNIATVEVNEGVATVTAVGIGTTTVTATAQDGSGKTVRVTINSIPLVQSIILPATATVAAGKIVTLTAQITPDSAKNKTLDWKIAPEDAAKATIANGRVTVKPAATGTITVTAAAKDGSGVKSNNTCVITVTKPAESVAVFSAGQEVTNGTVGLDLDETNTLQLNSNARIKTDNEWKTDGVSQGVIWKSANLRVATVDENGLVHALATGTSVITATATDGSGRSGRVTLNVNRLIQRIELSGVTSVGVGKSTQLTAKITPDSATNKTLLWSIDPADAAKATVANGRVTIKAGASGQVHVIAAAKDGSGITSDDTEPFYIGIKQPVDKVTIKKDGQSAVSPINQDLSTAPEIGLTAVCTGSNPGDEVLQAVNWKSSNVRIATVTPAQNDPANATVTLVAPGTATITATAADGSNKSATVTIKVTQSAITITGPAEVAAGKSAKLTAQGPAVNWSIVSTEP